MWAPVTGVGPLASEHRLDYQCASASAHPQVGSSLVNDLASRKWAVAGLSHARAGAGIRPFPVTVGPPCGATPPSPATPAQELGFGVLWATGISCIAVGLTQYDATINQHMPLGNLNSLVSI